MRSERPQQTDSGRVVTFVDRRGGPIACGLALLVLLLVPGSAQAIAGGDLDSSFGLGGMVTTDFGGDDDAEAVGVDSQGRTVAAGYTYRGSREYFAVSRYQPNGSLDPSFSRDGKSATTGLGGTSSPGVSLAIDARDRVLMAGQICNDADTRCHFTLRRYKPDGSIDRSFAGDGQVGAFFFGYDSGFATSLAIDSHGRIVAATVADDHVFDLALARFKPDGTFDSSFSANGRLVTDAIRAWPGVGVAIDPRGRIVVAGQSRNPEWRFGLARYHSDGSFDHSFGTPTTDFGPSEAYATSIAIDSKGRAVVAGEGGRGFALARYRPNGTFDGDFGKVRTTFRNGGLARDVAIDSPGRIVAVGGANGGFAVARYRTSGALDSSFSANGKATTTVGQHAGAESVAVDAEDRIVAAGGSGPPRDFALVRYVGYP
jgi:uncharacterized delta-60 repeat protein